MVKKKIKSEEIKGKILIILDIKRISLSIKKVRDLLDELYGIDISPQVTKRYLLKLEKEDKIIAT